MPRDTGPLCGQAASTPRLPPPRPGCRPLPLAAASASLKPCFLESPSGSFRPARLNTPHPVKPVSLQWPSKFPPRWLLFIAGAGWSIRPSPVSQRRPTEGRALFWVMEMQW